MKAPLFENRQDAGRRLAVALEALAPKHPVVLALPRGGVPVAVEVARALKAPLDLVLVRKIGVPEQPELALGAVTDGPVPDRVIDTAMLAKFGIDPGYVEEATARHLAEIERRRARYLGGRKALALDGRTVVVVDDGIATGATMRVALRAVRRAGAARIVLAVPVAPAETLDALRSEADSVVCLATPDPFWAVGSHYRDFAQVSDDAVVALMEAGA